MEFGALRDLVLELNLDMHGVPATVTPPGEAAIATRVIWLTPVIDDLPAGRDFDRREPRRMMVISRADVENVPRGTIIAAPEKLGGDSRNWQIDGVESTEPDNFHVIVVPETE